MYALSRYNYIIENKDRFIYFNGVTCHSFSVSKQEHKWLKNQWKDLIVFHCNYTRLFEQFRDWGYIADINNDEKELIYLRNHNAVFLDRFYRINISPTMECNFKCWYCPQKHPNSKMSVETSEKIKRHIKYMIEEEKITGLHLDWFGGEPTLYFDEIVYPLSLFAKKILADNKLPFINFMTTNAYLINSEMIQKMMEIDLNRFQITIDGDEKRHNKIRNANGKPSFDTIISNICLLCEFMSNADITLRINYDNATFNKHDLNKVLDQKIPMQHREKIHIIFQRVWQTYNNPLDQAEQLKKIAASVQCSGFKSTLTVSYNERPGVKCYADRYYFAAINYDGKVYKCTGKDYSELDVAGQILDDGKLIWDSRIISKIFSRPSFENKICLKCKQLPICIGPCHQKLNFEKCPLNVEITPEEFILDFHEKRLKKGREIIEKQLNTEK